MLLQQFGALVFRQIPERLEKHAIRLHSIFHGLPLIRRHILPGGFHALAHRGISRRKWMVGAASTVSAGRSRRAKNTPAAAGASGSILSVPKSRGIERQEHRQHDRQFASAE